MSLVVLVGPSGSGKSTFARRHFATTEILASDYCRGLVSDDENNQAATNDAFDVLHYIAAKRLAAGRLTVVDATNVQAEARRPLVRLAREQHVLPVAIVLNLPEKVCTERNKTRSDRSFGPQVIRQQRSQLRQSLRKLKREGFRKIAILDSVEEIESAHVERIPLWSDKRTELGPFDIIGDVHGCADELEELLEKLGYQFASHGQPIELPFGSNWWAHRERKAVFVGDLVDRGPRSVDALKIVMNMVAMGAAHCVPGNHDVKLLRKLNGKNVQLRHGLENTVAEIDALESDAREYFCDQAIKFIDGLVSHNVFDDGRLVVAHAGLKENMHGRASGKIREFALYGDTTGETDKYGMPIRLNWAADYRGSAMVVYGHTPVPRAEWLNRTINIDTGCVFGGELTALRYPEQELVAVNAKKIYCEPARPFLEPELSSGELSQQHINDDLLDIEDVIGKRIVSTRLRNNITIRAENSAAAMEVMSRFAANPKWLIYLPPTMSPSETSSLDDYLEHPAEAFNYFRSQNISQVICEEKHMGSRAIVVVCKDYDSARQRFGIQEDEQGIVYTRTGRRFFDDSAIESELLQRLAVSLTESGFWKRFSTNWVCLDCELMPWSAKAQELLRNQYAAVGAAGRQALPVTVDSLQQAHARLQTIEPNDADSLLRLQNSSDRFQSLQNKLEQFTRAYRRYCWPVESIDDFKLAPFHVLASEGKAHVDQEHHWHLEEISRLCLVDPQLLLATQSRSVELTNEDEVNTTMTWWEQLTENGGEGMVVKPRDFVSRGPRGLVQPAVKCRGSEYLRIIYGPDYDSATNLNRLRHRHLGRKQSLALREFALGVESLERFVRHEPLRRVHECVFGVLALESEPVDPRL